MNMSIRNLIHKIKKNMSLLYEYPFIIKVEFVWMAYYENNQATLEKFNKGSVKINWLQIVKY